MLKEIYYKISHIFFKPQIRSIGKDTKLRMKGRVIGGKYVDFSDGVEIEKGWTIAVYPEFGGKTNPVYNSSKGGVHLGENGSYNRNLTIYCADSVVIGKNVLFGSNILITDNEHGTTADSSIPYRHQPLITAPVTIGDECWIAENVTILKGTQIGKRCIVAANAVVKGTYPDYCILAGVPAKIVRVWSFQEKKWVKPNIETEKF